MVLHFLNQAFYVSRKLKATINQVYWVIREINIQLGFRVNTEFSYMNMSLHYINSETIIIMKCIGLDRIIKFFINCNLPHING